MSKEKMKHFYLIKIQFLGYAYNGWQKQSTLQSTIQEKLERVFYFILPNISFKILGASRTDARVSAEEFYLQLFTSQPIDVDVLFQNLNINLSTDIRALSIKEVDRNFRIINDNKVKEYIYLFAFGEKFHPFCAPILGNIQGNLDIHRMKEAASIFVGEHNFFHFTYKPSADKQLIRTIDSCEILDNDLYIANFFPEKSYYLKVRGKGFLRHQIRRTMGALIQIGNGTLTEEQLRYSLEGHKDAIQPFTAPGAGLILKGSAFLEE